MCDDKAGPTVHEGTECLLHLDFRQAVDIARSFVQQQDGRIQQQDAGDGQKLQLSLGKASPVSGKLRVISARQPADETVRMGGPSGR